MFIYNEQIWRTQNTQNITNTERSFATFTVRGIDAHIQTGTAVKNITYIIE